MLLPKNSFYNCRKQTFINMVATDRAPRSSPSTAADDNDNNDPMDTSNMEYSRLRAPCSDPVREDTLSGSDDEYTPDTDEEDGFDFLVIPHGTDDQSATKLLCAVENEDVLAPDNEDGNPAKKQKLSGKREFFAINQKAVLPNTL
jgi:hypothetical protein